MIINIVNKILSLLGLVNILVSSIVMSLVAIIAMLIFGKQVFHKLARIWAKQILWAFRIKLDVVGNENLSLSESYIFCSNHSSMLDIPVLQAGLKHGFRIIYKKELEKIPIFGWGLKLSPYISILRQNARDSMAGIETAVEAISTGESVVIFPEGTRSNDGKLQAFKRGAFLLAARSKKPIVPVTIIGSSKLLPNKKFLSGPGKIKIIINNPIIYTGEGKQDEMKLMEKIHNIISFNLQ